MIIYAKNQENRYSYYFLFNLIFTIVLLLDMIVRLVPVSRGDGINSRDVGKEVGFFCRAQAFLLTLFDKYIIILIADYSIISFVDKDKDKDKEAQEKKK
jgi:hypothetical protein